MLIHTMKRSLSRWPGLYRTLKPVWHALRREDNRRERVAHVIQTLTDRHGLKVLGGPFIGMEYVPTAAGSQLAPKVIGSYEADLHGVLERAFERQYTKVVDVGCAEGYYAVGLALRLPAARVYAFDIDPQALQLCWELACRNGVGDRVRVMEGCTAEQLSSFELAGAFMIVDCEGYELELLRPDLVPDLVTCDVLVELHEFVDRNLFKTVLGRFASTHDITVIGESERDPAAYPVLDGFSSRDKRFAVDERRGTEMRWAFMQSRVTHPRD